MLLKVLLIASLALVSTSFPTDEPKYKICETDECKKAADLITSYIDESKDPCDDWYLYACGKYAEKVPIPEGQQSIQALAQVAEGNQRRIIEALDDPKLKDHGSKVVKLAKKLYDECTSKSDRSFVDNMRKKNRDYLLKKRQQMIEEMSKGGSNTFIPRKIPTVDEILNLELSDKEECAVTVGSKYNLAIVRAFVDKFMGPEATAEARKMMNNIHSTILNKLQLSWASDEEKKTYKSQFSQLKKNFVFPDWIMNDKELDSEYDVTSETIDELINELAKHDKWPMDPLEVNAVFTSNNDVTIPAGILQDLVFNYNSAPGLNYGGGGFISGHEMSHAVDYYLANSANKQPALDCISKQLTSVVEPQTSASYWIGTYLLTEMLADVGSVNASLNALKDGVKEDIRLPGSASKFTPTQLFFLGEANSWCHHSTYWAIRLQLFLPLGHPFNYHRVVIPAMNSPDFAEAFKCKPGSKMNPVDKCRLW